MSTSKELVKENSTYVNEIQSVDREKQELRRTEERLHASERSVEEVEERVRVCVKTRYVRRSGSVWRWITARRT